MANPVPDGADVDSEEWAAARLWTSMLSELNANGVVSKADVAEMATRWHVSRATVWRRIKAYREEGNLTALLPKHKGMAKGSRMLDGRADDIIIGAARTWWRKTENATIAEIGPTVVRQCRDLGIRHPSRATIARRLQQLRKDPENFVGEAKRILKDRRRLVKSSYEVQTPLTVVQIDHTVADVFVVDPVSRENIGRPTLTVAIDVATRCVLGHCLSLEAPSALLVALCLERAVFPKDAWLSELGLRVEYPMHGQPKALHCDNGEEFHSAAFRRGCDLNNIDTIYRPPGRPRFGGHVERLIGTLMRRVRLLPGSSYSDMLRQRPRGAERAAQLTLVDLQDYLVREIAHYHGRPHRGLGMSPQQAWVLGWASGPGGAPEPPPDRTNFRLSFLPMKRRVVGREGIELFGLKYSCEDLAPHVDLGVARVVRYDPRNISRVYLETKGGEHIVVPLRDRHMPTFSLWEWIWTRRHNQELAARASPEVLAAMLDREPLDAVAKTAMQRRRHAARKAEWQELQRIQALPALTVALKATLTVPADGVSLAWEILE